MAIGFALVLGLSLLGLWERRGWAVWVHLLLMGLLLGVLGYTVWEILREWYSHGRRFPTELYLILSGLVFGLCLTIYVTAVGLRLTGQRWQKGPCSVCGRRRWIRVARCNVCGERYWLHREHPGAPVCLACGHEAGAPPVCETCALRQPAE